MHDFRKVWAVCANELRRWPTTPRILIAAILSFLWIHSQMNGILNFSENVHVPVTPWGLPFMFTYYVSVATGLLLEVLLFCDAPFLNAGTMYECIRGGKRVLITGKLLYIWLGAIIFAAFLWLMSLCCILPNVEWSGQWGRVYHTLSLTNAGSAYGAPQVPYEIVRDYSPFAANLICFVMIVLQTVFVGTVMFLLNSITRGIGWGVVGGLILAFLPCLESPVLGNIPKPLLQFFIPTGWVDLGRIAVSPASSYPGYAYILSFFAVALSVMYVAIARIYRRREIAVAVQI